MSCCTKGASVAVQRKPASGLAEHSTQFVSPALVHGCRPTVVQQPLPSLNVPGKAAQEPVAPKGDATGPPLHAATQQYLKVKNVFPALTRGFPVTGSVPLHVPASVFGLATPNCPGPLQGGGGTQHPLPSFMVPAYAAHDPVGLKGDASGPPGQAGAQQKSPEKLAWPGFTIGLPDAGSVPLQVPDAVSGLATTPDSPVIVHRGSTQQPTPSFTVPAYAAHEPDAPNGEAILHTVRQQ
jgi:hypothetical protein